MRLRAPSPDARRRLDCLGVRPALQKPEDEQPATDPLDVASMTREQRDALKRKLLAQYPHLVDELGLDTG